LQFLGLLFRQPSRYLSVFKMGFGKKSGYTI
jgi:hypothetical protein